MANEFARNIQDASLNPSAAFALPSGPSLSTTSSVVDLGADVFKPGNFELELSVPSLTSTMAPSTVTAGVTYYIESSSTSTFAATARTIVSKNVVGSTVGIAAQVLRTRVPSDCERYVRAGVTTGATAATAAAVSGTLTVRF
jgi:hypothetical protein